MEISAKQRPMNKVSLVFFEGLRVVEIWILQGSFICQAFSKFITQLNLLLQKVTKSF